MRTAVVALLFVVSTAANAACDGAPALIKSTSDGAVKIFRDNNAVVFTTRKLEVDVDGSPNAYGPDDRGLDYICNGAVAYNGITKRCIFPGEAGWNQKCNTSFTKAKAENWRGPTKMCTFGFRATGGVTDKHGRVIGGVPELQNSLDPHPGYYVSLSSLKRPETDVFKGDVQARQVDAAAVPYFVLPPDIESLGGINLGDIAAVWYPASKNVVFAVFGDGGPGGAVGEASAKLREMLGHEVYSVKDDIRRASNGIDEGVTFIVFPNSACRAPAQYDDTDWTSKIQKAGEELFSQPSGWGGLQRLQSCRSKQE
jgi:hypothetical protein